MDSRRLVRIAAPLLAIVTGAFGLYQLFVAGFALRAHAYPFAALYGGLGVGGLAIASALWRARTRV